MNHDYQQLQAIWAAQQQQQHLALINQQNQELKRLILARGAALSASVPKPNPGLIKPTPVHVSPQMQRQTSAFSTPQQSFGALSTSLSFARPSPLSN